MKTNPNIQKVFDHWNSYKRKGWHSHSIFSPEIEEAIEIRLKKYPVERLKSAIDNYALVQLSPDYRVFNNGKYSWDKKWTLREFLLRRPSNSKEADPYLYRFLPGTFEAEDYLTKQARGRRRTRMRAEQPPIPLPEITTEQKKEFREQMENIGLIPAAKQNKTKVLNQLRKTKVK